MKLLNRWTTCVLVGVAALLSTSELRAQPGPLIGDFQFFAPADVSSFDRKPYANEGFFVTFDYVTQWLDAPDIQVIGDTTSTPGLVFEAGGFERREFNSMDTGFYERNQHTGQIITVGYHEGHNGWMFRSFDLNDRRQVAASGDVNIILGDNLGAVVGGIFVGFFDIDGDGFDDDLDGDGIFGRDGIDLFPDRPPVADPPGSFPGFEDGDGVPETLLGGFIDFDDTGKIALVFESVDARLRTHTWSAELNHIFRLDRLHRGGWLEIYMGVRYTKFDETFFVAATNPDSTLSARFVSSFVVNTEALNDIVGPQIGLHWWKTCGHGTLSIDGRAMYGLNFQRVRQTSSFSPQTTSSFNPLVNVIGTSNTRSSHQLEAVPQLELGAHYAFQLTRSIRIRGGWRGQVIDGLARPSSMVAFAIPRAGIITKNNRQLVVSHGPYFGFELNR